jgi:hypothetical protein
MTYLVDFLQIGIVIMRYVERTQAEPSADIYVVPLYNLSAERMCGCLVETNPPGDVQRFCLQDGR